MIKERNNRLYNRDNASSPDNKESYKSYGQMKIEDWKSCRITDLLHTTGRGVWANRTIVTFLLNHHTIPELGSYKDIKTLAGFVY